MSKREHYYRILMRAYPDQHRTQYEDEMLAVILDDTADASPDFRSAVRETAAIVLRGLQARMAQRSELYHGLRLAGLTATAAVTCAAGLMIVVAAGHPLEVNGLQVLAWLVTTAVGVYATTASSPFRVVMPAAFALAVMVAGSAAMGPRRALLFIVCTHLLLSAAAPRGRVAVGSAVAAIGAVVGAALGFAASYGMNLVTPLSAGPWAVDARWQWLAFELVNPSYGLLYRTWLVLAGASLLLAAWRSRYLVASSALGAPVLIIEATIPGGLLWRLTSGFPPYRTEVLVASGVTLAAAALLLAVLVPRRVT